MRLLKEQQIEIILKAFLGSNRTVAFNRKNGTNIPQDVMANLIEEV